MNLVEILKEPALSVLQHAFLLIGFDLAFGLKTTEIIGFDPLIQLIQLTGGPIDDVVGVDVIIHLESRTGAVKGMWWRGRIEAETGTGGVAGRGKG